MSGPRWVRPSSWEKEGQDWPNREFSRFVDAAGLTWHVQVMGSGPAILLVHGTGAATHSWRDLAPLLARHFTVVAPDLPGGGGTPLAAGIGAALTLADAVRRKGETPALVLLTDGRANVARDGMAARVRAEEEALAAAAAVRGAGLKALLVDTSPKPQPQARRLAQELGALYLPLPHADAAALSTAARQAAAVR